MISNWEIWFFGNEIYLMCTTCWVFFCQPLATKLRYHKALKQQQANADSWCNWQQRQVIFCHKRRRFSYIDEIVYQNGERGQSVLTDYLRLIGTSLGVQVTNVISQLNLTLLSLFFWKLFCSQHFLKFFEAIWNSITENWWIF